MSTEPLDTLTRIRQARHEISAEHGHDPQRLLQHYLHVQHELRDLVSLRPDLEVPVEGKT